MGFNTGVLLLNDALYQAEKDKEQFASSMLAAIGAYYNNIEYKPIDFAIGNHVNGGTVFWQSHADVTGIFAIGGNYTTHLATRYSYVHHSDVAKLAILKDMAAKMGYRLVHERPRRKPVIK